MAQINPEDDFAGYMDQVQARQASYDRQRELREEHQQWLEGTWMGWAVRRSMGIGRHFAPFIESINDLFTKVERENTTSQIALTILLRVLIVTGYVLTLYVITRLLSSCLGRTIVLEEEIVVEYDGDEPPNLTPEQIAKLKGGTGVAQPQARGKKSRDKKKKQS